MLQTVEATYIDVIKPALHAIVVYMQLWVFNKRGLHAFKVTDETYKLVQAMGLVPTMTFQLYAGHHCQNTIILIEISCTNIHVETKVVYKKHVFSF